MITLHEVSQATLLNWCIGITTKSESLPARLVNHKRVGVALNHQYISHNTSGPLMWMMDDKHTIWADTGITTHTTCALHHDLLSATTTNEKLHINTHNNQNSYTTGPLKW